MPSIGYGSNRKTRNLLPDGFYKFVVNNVKVRMHVYTPRLFLVAKHLVAVLPPLPIINFISALWVFNLVMGKFYNYYACDGH